MPDHEHEAELETLLEGTLAVPLRRALGGAQAITPVAQVADPSQRLGQPPGAAGEDR